MMKVTNTNLYNDDIPNEFWLNFKDIVKFNVTYLYICGIIIPGKFKNAIGVFFYLIRSLFFIGFVFTLMTTSEIINIILNGDNFANIIASSYLFLTHVVQFGKYYYMLKNHKRLRILLKSINRKEFQPKNKKQQETLKEYITWSKIITINFWLACIATHAFWLAGALTSGEPFALPVPGWYPFDVKSSPGYEMACLYQILMGSFNGVAIIGLDTLMSGLIMVICAQLTNLNDALLNLRNYAEEELRINENCTKISPKLQEVMDKLFVDFVIHHKSILDYTYELQELFGMPILGQFIVSVIIICLTLIEMTTVPFPSYSFISKALYQYCMLLEIYLLCYYGNEITIKSNNLTGVAYHSDWLDCSLKYKKNLVFFMTRSQRDLKLFAGGFFALSLDTFVRIIKSSWSYFAVLSQVNE